MRKLTLWNRDRIDDFGDGAHERNRTFDLLLTKEVLYRLSYVSDDVVIRATAPRTGPPCEMFKVPLQWSGRRESNPHDQLGRLKFYH